MISADEVKGFGHRIGLDLIGITSADPFPQYVETVRKRFDSNLIPLEWRESVDIFRRARFYSDPKNSLPEAKSVISIGICYLISGKADNTRLGKPCGVIARYHWRDFGGELWRKQARLVKFLESKGIQCSKEVYLPDKLIAQRAGVGWYGKNGLMQTEAHGSWVVLSAIVTDADLDSDEPISRDCDSCQACIKACPTQAIVEPYTINASRCIEYLIGTSGSISIELRSTIANRISGCDRCQEVCPNNHEIIPVRKRFPHPRREWGTSPALIPLLDISQEEFNRSFAEFDKLKFLQRNIVVALGNIGDPVAFSALSRMLSHPESIIRSHAAWALGKMGGYKARQVLRSTYQAERETEVRKEIERALEMM
jgi:epoxyqueuosine reductase